MNGMKHGMTALLFCGMLAALSAGGCGAADETAESGSVPVRERDAYDLAAEKWKAYGEIEDCDEVWSALGYWDDLASDTAVEMNGRNMPRSTAEGIRIRKSRWNAGRRGVWGEFSQTRLWRRSCWGRARIF